MNHAAYVTGESAEAHTDSYACHGYTGKDAKAAEGHEGACCSGSLHGAHAEDHGEKACRCTRESTGYATDERTDFSSESTVGTAFEYMRST